MLHPSSTRSLGLSPRDDRSAGLPAPPRPCEGLCRRLALSLGLLPVLPTFQAPRSLNFRSHEQKRLARYPSRKDQVGDCCLCAFQGSGRDGIMQRQLLTKRHRAKARTRMSWQRARCNDLFLVPARCDEMLPQPQAASLGLFVLLPPQLQAVRGKANAQGATRHIAQS